MKRALCVGISDYGSTVSNLPGVANDVARIASLLSGEAGSFGDNLTAVLDLDATKQRIIDELEAIFAANSEDELFVYMAGHGMVENDHYYFVPFSTQLGAAEDWAVPLPKLKHLFDQCVANRVLVYLDFCHSGGVIPRDGSGSSTDAREAFRRDITISGGTGKMLYAACTEKQYAYEDTNDQYGYFTKAVANGLAGAAVNVNGEVTTNSLYDFVSSELEALNLPQQPMQFGQMAGRLVLRLYSDRSTLGTNSQNFNQSTEGGQLVIDSSGNLCMVGEIFYDTTEVTQSNDEITLLIESIDSTTTADVEYLRNLAGSHVPIKFGYQNKCIHVHVLDITTSDRDNIKSCSIKLKELPWQHSARSETTYSENGRTFTPLDIAVIATKKIKVSTFHLA